METLKEINNIAPERAMTRRSSNSSTESLPKKQKKAITVTEKEVTENKNVIFFGNVIEKIIEN